MICVVRDAVKAHEEASKIDEAIVKMFNDVISHKCFFNKNPKEESLDLFMNGECKHPRGDGHCCIAECPLGKDS